ncbi:MAG: putative LPS assembly protein LptD [Bacteroidales bacterium]|nr:putative LPS assembly protein LptD [Bacteroidales bacterium]MDD4670416.1 putative LPS assembly protein LptD [Bacteroidales bacterium]
MSFNRFLKILTISALVIAGGGVSNAQILKDSVLQVRDTTASAQVDSSAVFNRDSTLFSLRDTSSVQMQNIKSTLERPAFSTARDSVIEDFSNGRKIIYYFGDVTVTYGDLALKADYMAYDLDLNVVFAKGTLDTITNTVTGKPEMTDNGKSYTMDEVYYNFSSKKAKIKNMITQQDDGRLIGEKLKMMPDQSINISGGKYTVCDADHPHYYLRMTAAKVITEPSQKTVFGPAYPVIEDVPLPIALPFGFVPEMPDRASGILIPTYGEENARGLYLKDFGYSFVIGDYLDLALTGDIYSYGSWAARVTSRYKKRYAFDGSLSLSYSNDVTGEPGSKDYFKSKNFGVAWNHAQDSKARPGTSFRASVNFSSPSNNRYNSTGINESLQNQISSSISYSKTWSGMSLSVNALHSQNSRDSSYAITLPNITFSVNRFFPFKRKERVGKEKLYEKISFSYNTTLLNKINFKASEVDDPQFFNKLQNGMNHNFAIGLPAFSLLKYLQFTPSVSYGMNWFFREQLKRYNEETQQVESYFTDQFSTFGVTQSFSTGLSMSTRLYGMFNFGKKSKVEAIRHMITPSFGFSFMPEMGTPANGYTTLTYTNSKGEEVTQEYNKYSGMVNSPPGKGRTAALSFSFGNNIEAKIRNEQDTTGKGSEKIKLIDQLNINGSYNFLADSMKLSNISVSGSTTIFGKLGLSGNIALDPYAVNERGVRINKLNILNKGSIARLTNASASLSYALTGKGAIAGNDGHKGGGGEDYARIYYHPVTGEYIPGGWLYYLNPSIPWSLNFSYSYSYSKSYQYANEQLQVKNNHLQTLGISGSVRLTKALNFNFNTGFDLTKLKMTTTQLNATYDLHCFAITVSWVPNGQWESWSFRIAAKASALSDLLQFKKASSFWDK